MAKVTIETESSTVSQTRNVASMVEIYNLTRAIVAVIYAYDAANGLSGPGSLAQRVFDLMANPKESRP